MLILFPFTLSQRTSKSSINQPCLSQHIIGSISLGKSKLKPLSHALDGHMKKTLSNVSKDVNNWEPQELKS